MQDDRRNVEGSLNSQHAYTGGTCRKDVRNTLPLFSCCNAKPNSHIRDQTWVLGDIVHWG